MKNRMCYYLFIFVPISLFASTSFQCPCKTSNSLITTYSLTSLKGCKDELKQLVISMLAEQGYELINETFVVQNKPALLIIIVDTNKGKKFLKLHQKTGGWNEY